MRQLAKKIGLGLALTCSASTLALAQVPNVDKAKADAEQAKTAAEQGSTEAKEGAGAAKDTAAAAQKKDMQGVQEGASKTHKKAKKAKTSTTHSAEKATDTAKDMTGK